MADKQTRESKAQVKAATSWLTTGFEETFVNGVAKRVYDARELYEILGDGRKFETWFDRATTHNGLQDGKHFFRSTVSASNPGRGAHKLIRYTLPFSGLRHFVGEADGPRVAAFRKALFDQYDRQSSDRQVHRRLFEQYSETNARVRTPLEVRASWHHTYLNANFAFGSFTVLTLVQDNFVLSENFLLEHCLRTPVCRPADGSAGQAWHNHRRGQDWAGEVMRRPLVGKTFGTNPRVAVYGWNERRWAVGFFQKIYLPENVPGWPGRS